MEQIKYTRSDGVNVMGGLGFQKSGNFSQTGVPYLKYPNSLLVKVFKASYFPDCDFHKAKNGDKSILVADLKLIIVGVECPFIEQLFDPRQVKRILAIPGRNY